jgi:C-terminal processing protease CtpA/Prc
VPGRRYGEKKPVYVLTSSRTFSGAEEFAYNLKQLKRATIVGETTRGGAHPVELIRLDEHYSVSMPVGRAVNPVSGDNWEGRGVAPDYYVLEAEAFDVAYRLALESVPAQDMAHLSPREREALLAEAREALQALTEE